MYPRPKILISKCIEFDNCRYNAQIIRSEFVRELTPFVDFIPVCPELEIGLGVPREPIRIIQHTGNKKLYQPATSKDVTPQMNTFISSYFKKSPLLDGVILKSRSPSCGIKDVKHYPNETKGPAAGQGAGFFGEAVQTRYPYHAIETEGRLRNASIREHFLRKIFCFARFHQILTTQKLNDLLAFHTHNKLLLMAYNQKQLKKMGTILANQKELSLQNVFETYQHHLYLALGKAPRCSAHINILQHSFGFVSESVTKPEKTYFLNLLEQYKNTQQSLATLIGVLKTWLLRFDVDYLLDQTYFNPYPSDLVHADMIESCPSKDYWQ